MDAIAVNMYKIMRVYRCRVYDFHAGIKKNKLDKGDHISRAGLVDDICERGDVLQEIK